MTLVPVTAPYLGLYRVRVILLHTSFCILHPDRWLVTKDMEFDVQVLCSSFSLLLYPSLIFNHFLGISVIADVAPSIITQASIQYRRCLQGNVTPGGRSSSFVLCCAYYLWHCFPIMSYVTCCQSRIDWDPEAAVLPLSPGRHQLWC